MTYKLVTCVMASKLFLHEWQKPTIAMVLTWLLMYLYMCVKRLSYNGERMQHLYCGIQKARVAKVLQTRVNCHLKANQSQQHCTTPTTVSLISAHFLHVYTLHLHTEVPGSSHVTFNKKKIMIIALVYKLLVKKSNVGRNMHTKLEYMLIHTQKEY